ncbi:unnamed protein product [Enterobius vermicularis]|uniref:GB1/RHD3-type G domain-containing protein n=1 Tax=Enterobius vermicularis TaxID=51028 RepID=A0A0N4VQJ7_ENTVE|nr:unnamed protein product [Enterobius vermicularis]
MCDSKSRRGYAVNILKKSENGNWDPDEEVLQKILMSEKVKDKKVMVLSIAGPSRSGKSFLLNFLLEAASAVEQGRSCEGMMELTNLASGFSWRGGSTRETSGITMWSKPFLLRSVEGEEIAVLLIDTEGFFDAQSTSADCARIFGLSNLISSIQIYNLSRGLQLDFLKQVEIFGEYGSYAKTEKKAKPFQQSSPEIQETCKNIEQCFESSSCFLMPYPGRDVAEAEECTSSIVIDKEFLIRTESLVNELFSGKYLKVKEVAGCKVTCKELFKFFIAFTDLFNSNTVPPPKALFELIGEVLFEEIFHQCKEMYDTEIAKFLKQREEGDANADLQKLYVMYTKGLNEKRAFELQAEFQKLYGRATSSITAKFKTWLSDTGFEAFENYCQKLQVHFESEYTKIKSTINRNGATVQRAADLVNGYNKYYSKQIQKVTFV